MASEWDDALDSGKTFSKTTYNNGINASNNDDDEWAQGGGGFGSSKGGFGSSRGGFGGSRGGRGGGFGSNRNESNGYKPRQNDWICTSSNCAVKNFGSRTECFKCYEPKGDAEDAPADSSGGFQPRQRTEWMCTESSCSAKNFGNRTECFKCQEPKGNALDVPSDSSGGFKPRQSDWICTSSSCAAKNFGSRSECFKCHEPKGDAQDAPADSSGGFKPRQSDWICTSSSCAAKNFGSRSECFKCHEPKGDAQDAPADSTGGFKPRQSDWICTSSSCAAKNFGSRSECFKCHEPKGDAQDAPEDSSGGFKPRQSDWICTSDSCAAKNFGNRTECFKCHEPKGDAQDAPDSNESGGGGAANGDDKPKEIYIPQEADEDALFTMGISTGTNFNKFDEIPVKVTGDNIPPQCKSFEDAGLVKFVLQNIEKGGYRNPTPVQKNAIPIILAGRDIMACAQTGSGKTAAFLVPIINKLLSDERELSPGSPHVLIVSPTRELVTQIYYEAKKFAAGSFLKCCQIYGGTSTRHQSGIVGHGCHILVATPGRLKDFVDKTYIDFRAIRFVVLDEADRMLDLGFLSNVEEIMSHPTMVPKGTRQTLMFSATFADDIKDLASQFLHEHLFLTVGIVGGACQDVEQAFFPVGRHDKRDKLIELLDAEDPKGTIIFVGTKRNADFLATFLSEKKHAATSIHGDRLQRQREEALNDFKTNKMKILIATSVAARGLDIPNVCHVINYDLPKTIDDYVHRIGRTGRVGNTGKASSFYDAEQDSAIAGELITVLKEAIQTVPDFLMNGGEMGDMQSGAPQSSQSNGKVGEEEW